MEEHKLIDIIATQLPISTEDAGLLIKGIQKGYLSPSLDAIIALAYRDKIIEGVQKENKYLRSKLRHEQDRKIKEWEDKND